jgi:hypothetical protein
LVLGSKQEKTNNNPVKDIDNPLTKKLNNGRSVEIVCSTNFKMSEKNENSTKTQEYIFLREEIVSRTAWCRECEKRAATVSICVWGACLFLVPHFYGKEFSDKPEFALLLPLLMLSPIIIIYSQAKRIAISNVFVQIIAAYLRKFHEKPIFEEGANCFRWETYIGAWGKYVGGLEEPRRKVFIIKSSELHYFSYASLFLFLVFSIMGLRHNTELLSKCGISVNATKICIVIITLVSALLIHKYLLRDYPKDILSEKEVFWKTDLFTKK